MFLRYRCLDAPVIHCPFNLSPMTTTKTTQSAQPCCQSEASPTDCLANAAYTDFYDCRLQNDVFDEECLALSCDAVGTPAPTVPVTVGPTPVGGPLPETEAPEPGAGDDDNTDATSTSGARPLTPPSLLMLTTTKNNNAAAVTGAIALVAGLSAAVAALAI